MSLYVIATPIGNPEDISLRAKRLLDESDVVIGEEAKPTRRLLKSIGVPPQKDIHLLNEHSSREDLEELLKICKQHQVALVSDCGTPGFCDPGAHLVALCRGNKVPVFSVPGPSSLTALLSVCGHRLDQFYFQGFLPAKTEERTRRLKALASQKGPLVIMDTPYRLKKTLEQCREYFPKRKLILGMRMSQEDETVLEGSAQQLLKNLPFEKAEFVLIVV